MNRKGFTLLELLAVIIILGLIVSITVYQTSKSTDFARKETLKESARNIIKAADNYYADLGYVNFPVNGIDLSDLDLKSTDFKSGTIKLKNNEYVVVNLTDGKYCINGTKENFIIKKGDCYNNSSSNYVYYAELSPVQNFPNITIADCSSEQPNTNVYLRFEVDYGELINPNVCFVDNNKEACFDSNVDKAEAYFGFDSSWIGPNEDGSYTKPNENIKCIEETISGGKSFSCLNGDYVIEIENRTDDYSAYIVDYSSFLGCGISSDGILCAEVTN